MSREQLSKLNKANRERLARQLRKSAQWHAARGVPVFRLQYASKRPLADTHAELDATRDPAVINSWWQRNPFNIGAALRDTPWFALDIDARANGDETIEALGKLPDTVTVISGSGWPSRHVWLKKNERISQLRLRAIAPGIDIKGLGYGYVALPPSLHSSGGVYCYEASSYLGDVEVAECPDWIERLLNQVGKVQKFYGKSDSNIKADECFTGARFVRNGWLGPELKPGMYAVRCPNAGEHTQGRDFDGSTVLYTSRHYGFYGAVLCLHSHCVHVADEQLELSRLEDEEGKALVRAQSLTELERKFLES
jgi:hypothetical protein